MQRKKGVTILELLISISVISVIVLLLLKVMFSFEKVNNDKTYASIDEISRTEIIKNIESDFLELKLNGLNIIENNDLVIINFMYNDEFKELKVYNDKVIYDDLTYKLESDNASYDLCVSYKYKLLEDEYYFVSINVPVLIDSVNTTNNDDLEFTFIGLQNEESNYLLNYSCTKK